ncbi:MAG: hypothetical protein MZV63_32570 [Marinilabiliales bacterium]|nr:hypothetical protein [Marinilabiliales bacterium]
MSYRTKADAVTLYDRYIQGELRDRHRGKHIEGVDAFTRLGFVQSRRSRLRSNTPVFTAVMDNGDHFIFFLSRERASGVPSGAMWP